jgi:hypothetical protein
VVLEADGARAVGGRFSSGGFTMMLKKSSFALLLAVGGLVAACSGAPEGDASAPAASEAALTTSAASESARPDRVCSPPLVWNGTRCVFPHPPPPCHSPATCCVQGGGAWNGHTCE